MEATIFLALWMLTPQASPALSGTSAVFYTFTPSTTVGADTACRSYRRQMYRVPDTICAPQPPPCLEMSPPIPVACESLGGEMATEYPLLGEVVAACLYSAKDNLRGDCVTQEAFR